ncbi:MAG: DUF2332 domain-containing protein [Gammaproteobacteria bacterium]|nr:DUF2332 domain-containing protein [Gammaproteobacteria bacterium]
MLVRDALPLRLASAGHDLWRAGDAPTLAALCDGRGDAESNAVRLRGVLASHDVELLPWPAGPPHTNEVGRSVQLMTGLLAIAARHGPRIELLEIGSSAGLNLMLDRFHIDLAGVVTGPPDSPLTLTREWRGPPPPAVPINLLTTRGVDLAPVATTTALGAQRLLASVWPDHQARFLRLATALRVLCAAPPRVDIADAMAGLAVRLAEPQAVGVPRVLMSSIVWQYLDEAPQQQIAAAMAAAGALASVERSLGWVRVDANRSVHKHEITRRSWPHYGPSVLLGRAHPHGFWVERLAEPVSGYELP